MGSIISIQNCFRLLAGFVLAACLAMSASAQTAPLVMKVGTATINDSQHQWMKLYAAQVEKNSNGRIKVELYPASQLGSIQRMIEGTQFGSIQGFVGPPEFFAGIDSRYQVLGAPGVFNDVAHASRTIQDAEFIAAFLALGANKGLKGVGLFLYGGPMIFNTRIPVRKLADLRGMKIRVFASEMQMKQIRLLKATPVPMTLGEVAPALQQGSIDGQMSTGSVLLPMHFNDVARYVFETNHAIVTSMTVLSKSWYDKLAPDLQKVVSDAGQDVTREMAQATLDSLARQKEGWVKAGGEFNQPTAEEKAQLMKLMLPIGAEVTADKPEEKALYELLQKVAKRSE